MNYDNLHELINRYEDDIDRIYGETHDELFKWKAMKVWQDEWFRPRSDFASFADRFNAAKREFQLLTDNSRMHPSAGVVKLWEKAPGEVERLFCDVLLAESGDATARQNCMEGFLEGYEELRQKHFPGNWSFKQDRHSASVFIALSYPDSDYIFKSNEAHSMAKYIDFGMDIGRGMNFSLPNYYRMCGEIVSALREHQSLLDKHFGRLMPDHCHDESLHLLAFDLIYCCSTYGYYKGLTVPSTGKTVRKKTASAEPDPEYLARQETEQREKIEDLEERIAELERKCGECAEISLTGVRVTARNYGDGTVIAQDGNSVRVRFADAEKTFVLERKHVIRPRFENDDEIIAMFTEYADAKREIDTLQKRLKALQG